MKFAPITIASLMLIAACGGADEPAASQAAQPAETPVSSSTPETQTPAPEEPAAEAPQTETVEAQTDEISRFTFNPNGISQITWDDLMPEGEDLVLAQMYEEFYTEVRQNMNSQSQSLREAGKAGADTDPADTYALIEEGSAADTMEQIGTFNVVEELDGLKIRLPGYVVPLDFNADGVYNEFLLVPYFGACLHTPPPPPNQIVFVKADPGAKVSSIYDPVWVEGTMQTGQFESDTGDSAYQLTLSKIEKYEY